MESKRPRAYSYLRMSTDLQRYGDSKRRQLKLSEAYARQHGLELADEFLGSKTSEFPHSRAQTSKKTVTLVGFWMQ